MILEAEVSQKI